MTIRNFATGFGSIVDLLGETEHARVPVVVGSDVAWVHGSCRRMFKDLEREILALSPDQREVFMQSVDRASRNGTIGQDIAQLAQAIGSKLSEQ